MIKLWGPGHTLLGGTAIRCFDKVAKLKQGLQQCTIWPPPPPASIRRPHARAQDTDASADGADAASSTDRSAASPYLRILDPRVPPAAAAAADGNAAGAPVVPLVRHDPALRLLKLVEAYELQNLPRSPWLDRMAFKQVRAELSSAMGIDASLMFPVPVGGARGPADASASGGSDRAKPQRHGRHGRHKLPRPSPDGSPTLLHLHFPTFDFPVVFEDVAYDGTSGGGIVPSVLPVAPGSLSAPRGAAGPVAGVAAAVAAAAPPIGVPYWADQVTMVHDMEADQELDNPVEHKYHKLARGMLRDLVDPNLKPNRMELTRMQAAIKASNIDFKLSPDVAELLWKFRYSLVGNKKALTKFLLCVDWEDEEEAREAVSVLARWAPIDTEDALRLLSPDFRAPAVREHAVNALRRASDEDLVLYLLQLVQALRYEPALAGAEARAGAGVGGLGALASSAGVGPAGSPGAPAASASASASNSASSLQPAASVGQTAPAPAAAGASHAYRLSPLADFLIERAVRSPELANFLHWYLYVELFETRQGGAFERVNEAFMAALRSSELGHSIRNRLGRQRELIEQLAAASAAATAGRRDRVETKIEKLNALLAPGGAFAELSHLSEPVALPLNPSILTSGVVPKTCHIFKSALYPTVITFAVHPDSRIDWARKPTTAGLAINDAAMAAAAAAAATLQAAQSPPARFAGRGLPAAPSEADQAAASPIPAGTQPTAAGSIDVPPSAQPASAAQATIAAAAVAAAPSGVPPASYRVIFKQGDDLRQDQLIIQMIRLMDQQLKRVGLDLCLTPYRVLATSPTSGMLEMVLYSKPVSAVIASYSKNIMAFFRDAHPMSGKEYGIDPDVMDTYVKSCAGYCVITYLLGIGDRHLDNIMLTRDGHLFHVDFGYIFGRDPKPLPPPMRLTKEMIDGMGGPESNNYKRFKSYCCQAYNILRKSANLVLNLLNLMRDAGIEALAHEPDTTIAKVRRRQYSCVAVRGRAALPEQQQSV